MSGSNGALVGAHADARPSCGAPQRFLLATHENPDGDALGSLAGMQLVLGRARQGRRRLHGRRTSSRCPTSTASSRSTNLVTEPPADLEERTIVFLDCGNIDRNPADSLKRDGRAHPQHRPPPRQHAVRDGQPRGARGVVHGGDHLGPDARTSGSSRRGRSPRRSTSGSSPTPASSCTRTPGPRAHQMAAELIDAGVDVHAIYRRLFEGVPQGKLELLARGLVERRALRRRAADGHAPERRGLRRRPAPTRATPRASSTTCARSRAPRSPASCATSRATASSGRKVSLRATDDRVDVSAIARAQGGGGHRRAAGFSTTMDYPQLVEFLRASLAEQL